MNFFPPLKWEAVFLLVILEEEKWEGTATGGDPEARKTPGPNQEALGSMNRQLAHFCVLPNTQRLRSGSGAAQKTPQAPTLPNSAWPEPFLLFL